MSVTVGGKKKTKFRTLYGMPDTHGMAGMSDTGRLNGMLQKGAPGTMESSMSNYDYMPTIPGKRHGYKTLKGMPDTRRLNGGGGEDHFGNVGNSGSSLLQKKRDSLIQDPQERRRQGQMRLDETDNAPGFLKDKLMRNGSVTATDYGVCLKGEEEGAIPEDELFYGIKNGKRGWYPVEDLVGEGGSSSRNVSIKTSVMDVVVDVVWDPGSHQLLKLTKKVKIVADKELESADPEESLIFQATPLQDELQ